MSIHKVEISLNLYGYEVPFTYNKHESYMGHLSVVIHGSPERTILRRNHTLARRCRNDGGAHQKLSQSSSGSIIHVPIESIVDHLGNTVLHYACYGGQISIVTYLIEIMNFTHTLKNKEGLLPMQMAAAGNFVDIVKYLSSLSAVLTSSSSSSCSSIIPGNMDQPNIILSTPSNTSAMDESVAGFNSFHRAIQNNSLETVIFLLQNSNRDDSTAINTGVVSSLVNSLTADGSTALHIACKHGYTELCQQLLLYGANVNVENHWDLSAMHYACIGGYTKIVQLLLSAGVTISQSDEIRAKSNARPYLHTAAQYGRHEVVELIIRDKTFLPSDLLSLDSHGNNTLLLTYYYLVTL